MISKYSFPFFKFKMEHIFKLRVWDFQNLKILYFPLVSMFHMQLICYMDN